METKRAKDILHSAEALQCHLMTFNPIAGGIALSIYFDNFSIFKLGWNIAKNGKYVLITPNGGMTTKIKPNVPDEQIFVARDDFYFQGSIAQKKINAIEIAIHNLFSRGLDDTLIIEKLERLLQVKANIVKFSLLNEIETDDIIRRKYEKMQEQLILESVLETPNYGGSVRLAHSIIQDYLSFEITGEIAAAILCYFIFAFCKIVNEVFGKKRSNPKAQLALLKICVQYLQDLHDKLLREERVKYNLYSFYKITYLATLFGTVGTEVIKIIQKEFLSEALPESWSTKKYKAIDELNVHLGYSTFLYPAALKPYSIESFLDTALFVKRHRIEYVYPQIKHEVPAQDFEKVFSLVESVTADLPSLDLNSNDYPILKPSIMFDLALVHSMFG